MMTRTLIDIDDEAVAGAARVLGTRTKVDTVNRALADIAGRPSRLAFIEHMGAARDDLGDPEIMRRAWP